MWGCKPDNCLNDICDTDTGVCTDGCKIGLDGDYCDSRKLNLFSQCVLTMLESKSKLCKVSPILMLDGATVFDGQTDSTKSVYVSRIVEHDMFILSLLLSSQSQHFVFLPRGRLDRGYMVVGFITTIVISVCHH